MVIICNLAYKVWSHNDTLKMNVWIVPEILKCIKPRESSYCSCVYASVCFRGFSVTCTALYVEHNSVYNMILNLVFYNNYLGSKKEFTIT